MTLSLDKDPAVARSPGNTRLTMIMLFLAVLGLFVGGFLSEDFRCFLGLDNCERISEIAISQRGGRLEVGHTLQLTATVSTMSGMITPGRHLEWSSSDHTLLEISDNGLITSVAVGGPVTIAASSEGVVGTATFVVVEEALGTISVRPINADLIAGGSMQITTALRHPSGDLVRTRTPTWVSSDSTIVHVSQTGLATARGLGGPVEISASVDSLRASAYLTVRTGVVVDSPGVLLRSQPSPFATSVRKLQIREALLVLDKIDEIPTANEAVLLRTVAVVNPSRRMTGQAGAPVVIVGALEDSIIVSFSFGGQTIVGAVPRDALGRPADPGQPWYHVTTSRRDSGYVPVRVVARLPPDVS